MFCRDTKYKCRYVEKEIDKSPKNKFFIMKKHKTFSGNKKYN